MRHLKLALLTLAVPAALGAVLVFHPGVAFEATPLTKLPQADLSGTYTVDPMHTSVGFEIVHMGLSHVQGRFDKIEGKLVVDPKNPDRSSVTFRIMTESVDTNVAPRDADLRSKNYFDVAEYPEILFTSTRFQKKDKGYVVIGNLTMHGVTKEVQIPFEAHGPKVVGGQFGTRVGVVSAPLTLSRLAFGVGNGDKMNGVMALSDEVTIRLSLEATRDQ